MEERTYSINNYYLYSISHPGKSGVPLIDLSEDNEAQIQVESLTDKQKAIERVIAKTFFDHDITVAISDKIRSVFRSKLWRMGQCLSKLGGSKRQQQVNEWKDTIWPLTIEVPGAGMLLHQKRRLEERLEKETSKRQKLEAESSSLKKQVLSMGKVSKNQAKTIVALKTGKSRRRKSSKEWSSYSHSHQSVKRKSLVNGIKAALSFCDDENFIPLAVDVENAESGKREKIDLNKGVFTSYKEDTSLGNNLTHFALYVKDQFSLSDQAYREISQLTPSLPRLYKLKELSKGLNSEFDIVPSPDGFIGVQQSFKSRLLHRLKYLKLSPEEVIEVKLTGDGTNIAKHLHVVNFAFTILNEGSLASSPVGNHSLAILQVPEDYDSLSATLSDIVKEARNLQSVEVGGHQHKIQYFLGGDMKFLAIVCGIEAANAKFSCVWCKCSSGDRWDMERDWSAFDATKGARTVDEIEKFKQLPKTRRFGCQRSPIFGFIPIDHVIIDSLHLFLRVSDLLINLFIEDLCREDGIAKATLDRSVHSNVIAYEKFLNDNCKVRFRWYTSKETKQMQWRDLSGPEKTRLFNNVDLPKYFPDIPNVSVIQDIWKEFWRLFKQLETVPNPKELQRDIKTWVRLFLRIYQTKNVTPYVHSFAFHVPEFTEKYGTICKFTQQGLEKLNDVTTQHYQRGTNHHNEDALKQIMEKRNRIEQLMDDGFRRTLRAQHCGICKLTTHNRRRCPLRSIDGNVESSMPSITTDRSVTPDL